MNKENFEKENIFGLGEPNDSFAQYFVGNSYLNVLSVVKEVNLSVCNVTFEPGCRNNWHMNGVNQLLMKFIIIYKCLVKTKFFV